MVVDSVVCTSFLNRMDAPATKHGRNAMLELHLPVIGGTGTCPGAGEGSSAFSRRLIRSDASDAPLLLLFLIPFSLARASDLMYAVSAQPSMRLLSMITEMKAEGQLK